jgi:hypothetical protein
MPAQVKVENDPVHLDQGYAVEVHCAVDKQLNILNSAPYDSPHIYTNPGGRIYVFFKKFHTIIRIVS